MFQQIFNDGIWIKNWPGLNGLKRNDFVRLRIAEFWIDCKSTLPLIYPFVSMKYTKTGTNGQDRSHTTKYRFCPMDAKDFWREHWNVCFDDMWTRLARMLLMELLAVGRVFIVLRLKKKTKIRTIWYAWTAELIKAAYGWCACECDCDQNKSNLIRGSLMVSTRVNARLYIVYRQYRLRNGYVASLPFGPKMLIIWAFVKCQTKSITSKALCLSLSLSLAISLVLFLFLSKLTCVVLLYDDGIQFRRAKEHQPMEI